MDTSERGEQTAARQRMIDVAKDEAFVAGVDLLLTLQAAYEARFGQQATPRMLQEIVDCNSRLASVLVGFEG